MKKGIPEKPDFSSFTDLVRVNIGGHQPVKGIRLQIGGDYLNFTKDGDLKWYVFTALAYKDIFVKERITQFCGVITLPTGFNYDGTMAPSLEFSTNTCAKYNCTDENCKEAERYKLPKDTYTP